MGGLRLCQVWYPSGPSVRLKRSPAWTFGPRRPNFTILRGIHNHSPLERSGFPEKGESVGETRAKPAVAPVEGQFRARGEELQNRCFSRP